MMRVLITVERPATPGDWQVTITSITSKRAWSRVMHAVQAEDGWLPTRVPDADALEKEKPLSELSTADADAILAVYQRIASRRAKTGEVALYGRYLFDVLIGSAIWTEITAEAVAAHEHIELALCWDWKDGQLSRLHWEMMATADRFLAGGIADGPRIRDVAITRIVPSSTADTRLPQAIPRVLFVVGSSLLDRKIRPGAEIIGILQRPGSETRVKWRIIEQAKPAAIVEEIKAFTPDVVHFICHGAIDAATGEGQLQLQPDPEHPRQDDLYGAEQIWGWLSAGATLPAMVVLSACQSGTTAAGVPLETRLGPQVAAPLAADLVVKGIPIVIGMSGSVSDVACRLFTRRFAEVLMRSPQETLVNATALGRRAAFTQGNDPGTSVDWGFPTVFLSPNVEANYAPSTDPPPGSMSVDERLVDYRLRRGPIFCGRREFFDAFRELMDGNSTHKTIAASVETPTRGYGRTRLLEALIIQALVDGHIPCAVLAHEHDWKTPKTPLEVGARIDDAIEVARASLKLSARRDDRPIVLLQAYERGGFPLEDLPTRYSRAIQLGQPPAVSGGKNPVPDAAVRLALEEEFAELMRKARQEKPAVVSAASRAVLLLDDVDEYIELLKPILGTRFGGYGFGTPEEPVFMVLAFSLKGVKFDLLRDVHDNKVPGIRSLPLVPFKRDNGLREDMQVYGRVLMNPWDLTLAPGSDVAWVMNYDAPAAEVALAESKYAKWLKNAIPGELADSKFYLVMDDGRFTAFFKQADDDDRMQSLHEERG